MESERLRLRYLLPALGLAVVMAAGPVVGVLGTTQFARMSFVALLALLTPLLYRVRSWRKQLGISFIVLALECGLLVFLYFQEQFPLRRVVVDLLGATYAHIAWQATLAASGLLLIAGALILIWGMRAHKLKISDQNQSV